MMWTLLPLWSALPHRLCQQKRVRRRVLVGVTLMTISSVCLLWNERVLQVSICFVWVVGTGKGPSGAGGGSGARATLILCPLSVLSNWLVSVENLFL